MSYNQRVGFGGHDDRLPVIGLVALFLSVFLPTLRSAVRDFPQASLWIVLPISVMASLVLVVVTICLLGGALFLTFKIAEWWRPNKR
jgi:hypothetical protein